MKTLHSCFAVCLLLFVVPVRAQVVINEIFYHAPDDLTDLQWIELHNTSDQAVNLSGWRLSKALKFQFTADSTIAAHGYAVICRNRQRFQEFYQVPIAGEFSKALKHGGERLELRSPSGQLVDSVEFGTRPPWPRAADGWTASLERICPTAPGNLAGNWVGSALSEDGTRPGGTPGAKNSAYCASLPPVISRVNFPTNCIPPAQPIPVDVQVQAKTALKSVVLLYRTVSPGTIGEEKAVPMDKGASEGRYSAIIPGQLTGQIVRFRIQAVDQDGAERFFPASTEPRPALSCLVMTNVVPGKISLGYISFIPIPMRRKAPCARPKAVPTLRSSVRKARPA